MNSLLEVRRLSVDIPLNHGTLRAVRDVSLSVDEGQTLCIVGESGCGKSLTSLAIMGLLPRQARMSAESVLFDGLALNRLPERSMEDIRGNDIAMIFQEPMTSLNPSFTIGNQLEETLLRHKRVSRSVARERAVYLLERVGIRNAASRLRQYPHQLSGGLRQRVMIAMALMCEPKLLIADEPTTALDVTTQAQILNLLKELAGEFRMALVLITHDFGVVARIAQKVAVMYAGEIVEIGDVLEIFNQPSHVYTQALLRCIPDNNKVSRGARLGTIAGNVPSLTGKVEGCAFRQRCELASERCGSSIELEHVSHTHAARCVLVDRSAQVRLPCTN